MSSELRPGDVFANHKIEAEAGAGGMGVVYRATHVLLERTVALKLIAPQLARDPAFRSRFEREWRLLAALEHPNVIGIYEAGEVEGRSYLSMRWVSGGDLAARLRGTAGLEPGVAVAILAQVAAALDAAHGRGVVHRDIKPANVLLEGDHAWLTDFGAGKDLAARDTRTATGHWLGTVDYVAPELLDGAPATPRSDVYSFGCVLFEALTGRVPFPRETEVATLWAHRFEPPPATTDSRPGLPAAVDDVLRSALAKVPEERPASAGEVMRAARAALATRPAGAATRAPADGLPAAAVPAAAPTRARRAPLLAGLAAALVLAGAGVAFALTRDGAEEKPAAVEVPPPRVERIVLGKTATAGRVVATPGFAYVADPVDREIVQIVDSSRQVGKRIKLRSPPHDLALSLDESHLWVMLEDRQLADIDLENGGTEYVKLDIEGRYVATTEDEVVVLSPSAAKNGGQLQRVDPRRHRVLAPPTKLGGAPTDLDGAFDHVLETVALTPYLVKWDATVTKHEDVAIPIDGIPAELLVDGRGKGWVTNNETGEAQRFDINTGEALGKPVKLGRKPDGIAGDADDIWIADREGRVDRLSARTGVRAGPPIDARGPLSGDIAVAAGVVWAPGTNDVARIEPRGD